MGAFKLLHGKRRDWRAFCSVVLAQCDNRLVVFGASATPGRNEAGDGHCEPARAYTFNW